jgi:hypothetical protein
MTLIQQKELDALLVANPDLTANGFLPFAGEATNPVDLGQVDLAIRWLDHHGKRVTVNYTVSSYGLKHHAEKTAPALRHGAIPYISNGAFIAAALYLNYQVVPMKHSPNARMNIRFDKKAQAELLEKAKERSEK